MNPYNIPFNELYQGLLAEVEKGWIRKVDDPEGPLELYNYTEDCQEQRVWNPSTIVARGLVLDPIKKKVVAHPFPKFFNLGEPEAAEIHHPIKVTEKMDGSLVIAFWDEYQNKFRTVTRGSFTSPAALSAQDMLPQNLNKDYTYLLELIGPDNWVVVKYPDDRLILLTIYDQIGHELNWPDVLLWGRRMGVDVVQTHVFDTVGETLQYAQTLPNDREGFVIRDRYGSRVKVKGPEYLKLHKFLSRITPKNVWRWMRHGEGVDPERIPDEFLPDFKELQRMFEEKFEEVLGQVGLLKGKVYQFSRKELALTLNGGKWPRGSEVTRFEKKFAFHCFDLDFPEKARTIGSKQRRNVFDEFEPKGKHLDGFEPLNSMI